MVVSIVWETVVSGDRGDRALGGDGDEEGSRVSWHSWWRSPFLLILTAMVPLSLVAAACGGQSLPDALREGRDVYGDSCSSCHGRTGQGGVGPALESVMETWPSCQDHQDWVALGSERWKVERGPTYGADDAPITAVMPSHADRLSTREIAAVAAFERVQYGGGDAESVLADCGLSEP